MIIMNDDGRPQSVRTDSERLAEIEAMIRDLPDEERAALMILLEDQYAMLEIQDLQYDREPVGPRQFIEDDYYLGASCGPNMWPRLRDDFEDLFTGGFSVAVFGGSTGWGKSYSAAAGLIYTVYLLSCIRNPQQVYGLAPGSTIEFAALSMTRDLARRRVIPEITKKLAISPYFNSVFPYHAAPSMLEIRFPKDIQIVGGSTVSANIGGNVFGGYLDEISFMGESKTTDAQGQLAAIDRGEMLANQIERRIRNRFSKIGRVPGVLFLVSSKERPVAYVEKRIDEARESADPTVFVREYATWDVKPPDTFSPERFQIAVGNERMRAIIDPTPQDIAHYKATGCRIIAVPEDFRTDFERDLEGSLREIAGVATESISPYFQRTDRIYDAEDERLIQPVPGEVMSGQIVIDWGRVATSYVDQVGDVVWEPRRHPDVARYGHIDLAAVADSAGIVIGHAADWVEVIRRADEGDEFAEIAPVIEIDVALRVLPPPGDEIHFGDLRSIIYGFQSHGFELAYVTYDSWQSVDSRQQLMEHGIESDILSVDRTTAPYDTLKMAAYEGRLRLPHPADVIIEELIGLRRVIISRARVMAVKIDHPRRDRKGRKGRKDVADALAAVAHSITEREIGGPVDMAQGARDTVRHDGADRDSKSRVSEPPNLPFLRR